MTHLHLTIEPIAAGSRLASLAKLLPRRQWDRLRRAAYRHAGYRCQACGGPGRLHCHEVWQYNDRTGYQWLRGFQALCARCHAVKHLAFIRDPLPRRKLLQHFMAVNRLSQQEARRHLDLAWQRHRRLNRRTWIVSFGRYNFDVPALADLSRRRRYVRAAHSGCQA